MNRKEVIKKFTTLLEKDALVIFVGKSLCEEAYLSDDDNYLYLLDSFFISVAVGVAYALPNNKRVFVVFDDKTLMDDFSSIFQVFLSRNTNLFLVFFYDKKEIFKKISHVQGVFFDVGIQSFSIDNYFGSTDSLKKLKILLREMRGPKVYSMGVDVKESNKLFCINKPLVFFRDRFNLAINKLIEVVPNGI